MQTGERCLYGMAWHAPPSVFYLVSRVVGKKKQGFGGASGWDIGVGFWRGVGMICGPVIVYSRREQTAVCCDDMPTL